MNTSATRMVNMGTYSMYIPALGHSAKKRAMRRFKLMSAGFNVVAAIVWGLAIGALIVRFNIHI
jgi:hypothetical protein